MNKNYFWGICMLTASMAVSSCSSDDAINSETSSVGASKQTISLAVANTGDNFVSTRAGRELYSSAAMQDINKVKVVIYKLGDVPAKTGDGTYTDAELTEKFFEDNIKTLNRYGKKTIVAQKEFSPWMNSGVSSVYSDGTKGHGRQASWTLSTDDQITDPGVYMAYAVGYNDKEYTALSTFDGLTKTSTDVNFPLSVAQNTNKKVYEIFAGSAPFIVTKKTATGTTTGSTTSQDTYEFNVSLTLHRQVAGTIGYFTNIPVKGNADHAGAEGTKLRLVASNKSDNAVFAYFNSAYTGQPNTSSKNVQYVVNGWDNSSSHAAYDAMFYGSTTKDAYTVYEVALANWFPKGSGTSIDSNGDGVLNGDDTNWTNYYDGKGVTVKKGTVLGSSFLFPFALVADKATFQLQMLNSSGKIIRYWNIRLQADSQIGKGNNKVTLVKSTGATESNTTAENVVNYSILRNHLYNIGKRDAGDNPGVDSGSGDEAQDLNNETLILRVNDNWEMIHQMVVD